MYTLYIGNKNYSSWSLRPWVLMRALGVPFEERLEPFDAETNWERFRTFSDAGLVPCLHDGDTVVWDSLAITEYLAEEFDDVWPSNTKKRAWARSVTAEMHSGFSALRNQCPMNCGLRVELSGIGEALRKDLGRIDEIWTSGLNRHGGPYLTGTDFTAADAFFAPVSFRVQTYNLPLSTGSLEYAGHLRRHPAMKEWYEEALREPWREDHHEDEASQSGRILNDFRTG